MPDSKPVTLFEVYCTSQLFINLSFPQSHQGFIIVDASMSLWIKAHKSSDDADGELITE
jgi:hypothetical protein